MSRAATEALRGALEERASPRATSSLCTWEGTNPGRNNNLKTITNDFCSQCCGLHTQIPVWGCHTPPPVLWVQALTLPFPPSSPENCLLPSKSTLPHPGLGAKDQSLTLCGCNSHSRTTWDQAEASPQLGTLSSLVTCGKWCRLQAKLIRGSSFHLYPQLPPILNSHHQRPSVFVEWRTWVM